MIIFGGFNGDYYNDLNYINVFELKSKIRNPPNQKLKDISSLLNEKNISDAVITCGSGNKKFVNKGLLAKGFKSYRAMEDFIEKAEGEE